MNRQIFNTGSCPFCGSGRIHVTSSQKPRRFWKCRVCGKRWKTLEVIERHFWLSDALLELLSQGRLNEFDFKTRQAIVRICDAGNENYHAG